MSQIQKPSPKASSDQGFFQEPPTLKNQYEDDIVLQNILKKIMPKQTLDEIEPDLYRFGQRVLDDIAAMGDDVENPNHYPQLKQYDAWCRRVDEISTAQGWKQLNDVSAEEGLVAIAYERKQKEFSRVYQFAKLYLFNPASAVFSCPLTMTDGAARVIELLGDDELKEKYFTRLTSRDPKKFWTSGQWMTERPGGSDVSRTETQAELLDAATNTWSVSGFKWFSSATTADMTMLLARSIDPKDGTVKTGSRGLSLYLAEMRNTDGQLNGVRVHRLKNKFGTKGLPTAELELDGMKATMLGNPGRGVPSIATLLNITRLNACLGVVCGVRRSLALSKDFSAKRFAFGRQLDKTPLHITTLVNIEMVYRAGMQIVFYAAELLGRSECHDPNTQAYKDDYAVLRFITPIAKAYVCKIGVQACSEAMESLGGQGYMEETGMGRCVRDAQVNTIWEGTTNVLAMDVLRVINETKGQAMLHLQKVCLEKVARSVSAQPVLKEAGEAIKTAFDNIVLFGTSITEKLEIEATARQLTFALGRALAGTLLVEQAAFDLSNNVKGAQEDVLAANKWCLDREFTQTLVPTDAEKIAQEAKIVFGSDAKL